MPAGTNGKIAQPEAFVSSENEAVPLSATVTLAIPTSSRSKTFTISRPWPELKPLLAGGVTSPTRSTVPRVSGDVTEDRILRFVCVFAVAAQPVEAEPASVA